MKDLNKQDLVSIQGGSAVLKAAGVAVSAVTGYFGGMTDNPAGLSLPVLGAVAGTALWTAGNRSVNAIVIGSLVNFSVAAISYVGAKNPNFGEL